MMPPRVSRVLPVALLFILAACAPVPVRTGADAATLAAQSAREAVLAADTDWTLVGRLSVDAGGDGGSGRIEWAQRGDDFTIRLSAPVTRRSWVLARTGEAVVLSGLEGGEIHGTDAQAMLEEATGWRIPLQALAQWARGGRADGPAQIEFGPGGLPALISQQGWVVDYREWDEADPPRPRRVFATQGDAGVRLVVEAWGEP